MPNSSVYVAAQGSKNNGEFQRYRVPQIKPVIIDFASMAGHTYDFTSEIIAHSDLDIQFNPLGAYYHNSMVTTATPQSSGKWYYEVTMASE